MPTRRMLVLSGALTAVIAAVLPWKVVAGADGLPRIALSTVAAKDGNGDGGSGNGGGSSSGNGSDNGGSSGNNGNGSSNGNSGGNGNAAGTDTGSGSTGSGTGPGTGAGSAPAGEAVNPGKAAASPAQPAAPAPAAPSKAGVEVDVRGTSITVRHHNGATERISQGRYEMRDSQSRTIVNRTATPSDASRLRSFGR